MIPDPLPSVYNGMRLLQASHPMSVRMDGPELKRYSPERETPRAAQGRPLHPWPPPGALRLKECACALSGTACLLVSQSWSRAQGPSTAAKNAVCFQNEHAAPSLFDRQTRLKKKRGEQSPESLPSAAAQARPPSPAPESSLRTYGSKVSVLPLSKASPRPIPAYNDHVVAFL